MSEQNSKTLHIALWVAQVVLGAMFLMAGFMKSTQPIEELSKSMPWTADMPSLTRFIGVSEALGALGLLLPSLLRIKPGLTPLAAYGLALVMLLAAIFHITRAEYSAIGINVVLMSIALFIAWGRSKKAVIHPKA